MRIQQANSQEQGFAPSDGRYRLSWRCHDLALPENGLQPANLQCRTLAADLQSVKPSHARHMHFYDQRKRTLPRDLLFQSKHERKKHQQFL
jgi:hypothetical protein